MIAVVVREQLKRMGLLLLVLVVLAAALPIASTFAMPDAGRWAAPILARSESLAPFFPVLAMFIGVALGIGSWHGDHDSNHTYALTLPVTRWHYVLLRATASLVLLVPVYLAFAISCLIAIRLVELPPELHAYPLALTTRFVFATLAAFAIFFAISAGTAKTAGRILLVIVVLIATDMFMSATIDSSALSTLFQIGLGAFSPIQLLLGRWMLFDV